MMQQLKMLQRDAMIKKVTIMTTTAMQYWKWVLVCILVEHSVGP